MGKVHGVIENGEDCVFESSMKVVLSAGAVRQELQEFQDLRGLHRRGIH